MGEYKEVLISGRKYQRLYRIEIELPVDKPATIQFIEEVITELADGTISHRIVDAINTLYDSKETVAISNLGPEKQGENTSEYSIELAHTILNSLYQKKAIERDELQKNPNPTKGEA